MGAGELLGLAGQFGPLGLMLGYVIWDKNQIATKSRELEERRLESDQKRIEADRGTALAMQGLTIAISSMGSKR